MPNGPTCWSRISTSCRSSWPHEGVRFCAIVPHLFGETVFQEAPWPVAAAVWLAERPLPMAYRGSAFHAISESTRDDLVARGIPAGSVRVIHPGVDSAHLTPDPAGRREPAPTFLYVGRLKRYKGIGFAIRALAVARRSRPELRLIVAGAGDYLAELQRLAAGLGQADAVDFRGFVTEAEKIALLRSCVGERLSVAQGRVGNHGGRGGGVRYAIHRLGQPGASRFGPGWRDRLPCAARRRRCARRPDARVRRLAGARRPSRQPRRAASPKD